MKVYIIKQAISWEDSEITSVFTDKKQAERYAKKSKKDNNNWGNCILECELDKYVDWRKASDELKRAERRKRTCQK